MPTVFWFLNDRLEESEIRRQIAAMSEANIGGFFLHARMGRLTPYLSEQWFSCVEAAVEEAAGRGLYVWIYDEDNWPSGYAGGRVLALGDWTRQRYARAELLPAAANRVAAPAKLDGIICAYSARGSGSETRILERLDAGEEPQLLPRHPDTEAVLVFHRELHRARREFCPEEVTWGYVNVFDPQVTDAFIESTYEQYYRRFSRHFGSTIAGFFFDEPQYHELGLWGDGVARFPWSETFPQAYEKACGRELLQDLPLLLWEIGDFREARYCYYRLLSEQFAGNFTARLSDWCEEHGVKLTGHVILEEFPRQAVRCVGDPMAHYAAAHIPGIDHLGKDLDLKAYWSSVRVLCKQVQSAACQLGKQRVLCEAFAGATNFFGMSDQKWMGDWLLASGVDLLCYHAFHYSLRGYRKRDYPPTLSYQQPWFRYSAGLGAHFARVSKALCQGKRVADVLLIHPMESFWSTQSDTNFSGEGDELTESLKTISEQLVHCGFDWDYGNESYLERWGRVQGNRLILARGAYSVVIVPPVTRLRNTTVKLVERFRRKGGLLLVIEAAQEKTNSFLPLPDMFPGAVRIGKWNDPGLRARIVAELRRIMPPQLEVLGRAGEEADPSGGIGDLVFQERRLETGRLYFIASSARIPRQVRCRFLGNGVPRSLDTIRGEVTALPLRRDDRGTVLDLQLGGSRSQLIEFDDTGDCALHGAAESQKVSGREIRCIFSAQTDVPITLLDRNVLILDRVNLSIGGRDLRGLFLPEAAELIANMGPDRAFRLDFPFESVIDLHRSYLLIESPAALAVAIDGRPLKTKARDWQVDTHLRLLPLPALEAGSHSVSLLAGSGSQELEPLYIAGAFGVQVTGPAARIVPPPSAMHAGSWTDQGLPFYAGRVRYHLSFTVARKPQTALVCFSFGAEKDARHLRVNGRDVATCIVPPFQADISARVRRGGNSLDITVANHLRNFLGPHHIENEDSIDCFSPADFFVKEHFTPRYLLKPAGILGEVFLHLT